MSKRECNFRDLEPHIKALVDAAGLSMDQVYKVVIKPRAITVKHYLLNERGHKYLIPDPKHPQNRLVAKAEVSIALNREAK